MDEKEKNLTPEEENAPENIENEVKAEVADTVEATKNVAEAAECIAAETAENAEAAESIAAETAENAENVSADGEELAIADIVEIDEAASAAKDTKISEKAENDRKTDAESGEDKPKWKKITTSVLALVPAFICFVIILLSTHLNGLSMSDISPQNSKIVIISLVLLALSTVLGVARPRIPKAVGWVLWALAPAGIMLLCEWIIRDPFGENTISVALIIFNMLIYYIASWFFLFVSRNTFVSTVAASVFPLLLAVANHYVHLFRGTVLFPWDLQSIGVAMTVVDNYRFDFPVVLAFVLECFVVMWQLVYFSRVKIFRSTKKLFISLGCALLCLAMGFGYVFYVRSDRFETFFKKSTHSKETQKYFDPTFYPYLFTPNAVYNHDGMMVSVIYALKFMNVEKPDGYSEEAVAAIADKYADEADPEPAGVKPNIIVIMNEAWSDVSVDAPFETNLDVFPVTSQMTDNVVRGQMYMSVLGGNTANSEYEFLTSSSMAFLPPGSVPYQSVIKYDTPTLVTALEEQGYQSVAMHPYNAAGWDRNKVYPFFGFDEMYFKDSFPAGVERFRSYISDSAMYNKIEELYEARDTSKPFFLFGVTMQNHGGYTSEDFEEDVFINGLEGNKKLSQYLSLIRISDVAFGEIVEYFSKVDEPTIILMFGDHQPGENVTAPLYGHANITYPPVSYERQQDKYIVPFIMWANYDIEEKDGVMTSPNYLSILLCETAGLKLTPYQKYLAELQKEYPVITANFFIDAAGEFHTQAEMESVDALVDYQRIAYNQIIDYKNRAVKMYTTVK